MTPRRLDRRRGQARSGPARPARAIRRWAGWLHDSALPDCGRRRGRALAGWRDERGRRPSTGRGPEGWPSGARRHASCAPRPAGAGKFQEPAQRVAARLMSARLHDHRRRRREGVRPPAPRPAGRRAIREDRCRAAARGGTRPSRLRRQGRSAAAAANPCRGAGRCSPEYTCRCAPRRSCCQQHPEPGGAHRVRAGEFARPCRLLKANYQHRQSKITKLANRPIDRMRW